jgi:hypothetical protein
MIRARAIAFSFMLVLVGTLARADAREAVQRSVTTDAALREVDVAVSAWDIENARASLVRARPGAARDVRAGIVAVYEGDYEEAERLLAGAIATGELPAGSREAEQAQHFLALARGSRRALGSATVLKSPDGHFQATFASPKDTLLAPYLFDAMARARQVLAQELGVAPDHTVRFEFVDVPAKLAMVTPLSLDNIRTTGTIGVTKHRRIVMVTPRVLLHGYPWLDDAVHEYVHYLVSIATHNRAPVWLHEGLAKVFETYWRTSAPTRLPGPVAHLLHRAIVRDELVSFAEMYPSMAMLPSQEKVTLAYAEVHTMLALLHERGGSRAIRELLVLVDQGVAAEQAVAAAWGAEFDDFLSHWRRTTRARTARAAAGELPERTFESDESGDEDVNSELVGDVFSNLGGGRARQHARLGVLLTIRGHLRAAAMQYEKARAVDREVRAHPELARRLGEVYLKLEDYERAAALLAFAGRDDPENANIAAAEGRARLRSGDRAGAHASLMRAIRKNPFIPTIHCDLAELATDPDRVRHEQALCRE